MCFNMYMFQHLYMICIYIVHFIIVSLLSRHTSITWRRCQNLNYTPFSHVVSSSIDSVKEEKYPSYICQVINLMTMLSNLFLGLVFEIFVLVNIIFAQNTSRYNFQVCIFCYTTQPKRQQNTLQTG